MESNSVVEVKGLSKKYGRVCALADLEFNIHKGEIFGIIGPNGAGKSTFISVLTTLVKPTAGDVLVNSESILRQPRRIKKFIGYVPQDIALYPTLTGLDNLNFWAGIYGLTGNRKKERIEDVLSIVKLEDRAADKVSVYSGGMKRRLNIAVALLHKPDILVMDEPTVGVDVQSRRFIMQAVENIKRSGKTVIFASHNIDEMESICDRIAIINRGRISAVGTVPELTGMYSAGNIEEILLKLIV